jgi:cation diffusion facilitator CzcD-associated flavoprotein CzcO
VRWDEADSRWRVRTDREDDIAARFLLISGGVLHKPKLPAIPGIETFKGASFHSSRWDYAYTGGSPTAPMDKLRDKRVALIGTGCTGIQLTPKLADAAAQVYVFQRTPAVVAVRGNRPTDPAWAAAQKPGWQQERIDNFTRIVEGERVESDLIGDGWTDFFTKNPNPYNVSTPEQAQLDFEIMEGVRARVDVIVENPNVAEALKPWYHTMCKRPTYHDEYLGTFNRSNVTLVDTEGRGVERITTDSLIVRGVAYSVDCIIFASGFEVGTGYEQRLGFDIFGRDGLSLGQAWATTGPQTLHGLFARGFPNLVMFSTTQAGQTINYTDVLNKFAVHAAWVIRQCLERGVVQVEPSEAAQTAWWEQMASGINFANLQFAAECTPSYYNAEGGGSQIDPNALRYMPFPAGFIAYVDILRAWRETGDLAGFELRGDLNG